jgi:hypothetical protein
MKNVLHQAWLPALFLFSFLYVLAHEMLLMTFSASLLFAAAFTIIFLLLFALQSRQSPLFRSEAEDAG